MILSDLTDRELFMHLDTLKADIAYFATKNPSRYSEAIVRLHELEAEITRRDEKLFAQDCAEGQAWRDR